jgi:Zn-dependent protease
MTLCRVGLILNVILAAFNLIPVPPLDGSWILIGLLPKEAAKLVEAIRPYGFLVLILLLYSGFIGVFLRPVIGFVRQLAY